MLTASAHAAGMGGSDIWLKEGEQMTVDDAFYLNEVRLLENGFDSQFHLGERAAGVSS